MYDVDKLVQPMSSGPVSFRRTRHWEMARIFHIFNLIGFSDRKLYSIERTGKH